MLSENKLLLFCSIHVITKVLKQIFNLSRRKLGEIKIQIKYRNYKNLQITKKGTINTKSTIKWD